jgi:hypothetical protein
MPPPVPSLLLRLEQKTDEQAQADGGKQHIAVCCSQKEHWHNAGERQKHTSSTTMTDKSAELRHGKHEQESDNNVPQLHS